MQRRSFLKVGAAGGAVAAVGLSPIPSRANNTITETDFVLTIEEANMELIDGSVVYTLQFFRGFDNASPELRVEEGEKITITVTNNDHRPHGFVIHAASGTWIPPIPPGETASRTFIAPAAGTYMYLDGTKGPLHRLMGLHGVFVVEPANKGRTVGGAQTPYSQKEHNPQLQMLFEAFGNHPRFPGSGWIAGDETRDKVWLFSQIDPSLNASFAAGESIDSKAIRNKFTPRYFTINGLSGFDTAHHDSEDKPHEGPAGRIMPSGRQGEPCLLRCLNAGLANHAVHIHGNHCFEICETDYKGRRYISENIYELDTWLLRPMQRIDMLLPFERPPDAAVWPPRDEPFPLKYVMHCHFELSQSAGGGNYPQGAVTHWEMTGAL
ncbi:multicopper oxidase domain-containing protein [Qipengyuania aurantiaca]|uniref:Multicopper oxidase domain-containing protein n=1 Tax=Qipengyuania aurantiaca TaxID=2867233 RepID=A0ABX8ZJ07_9SPHN|nr:multicopper oxidase domain-containing protein [Qipengyuania aurantiaca]QZD88899.1 multicopper oxidase domain-containing protein [Qipengyuania aurantiaca]